MNQKDRMEKMADILIKWTMRELDDEVAVYTIWKLLWPRFLSGRWRKAMKKKEEAK